MARERDRGDMRRGGRLDSSATPLGVGLSLLSLGFGGVAAAQDSPRMTPPSATAEDQWGPPHIVLPRWHGRMTPPGAAEARFVLRELRVENDFAGLAPASFAAENTGREISVADVYGFAEALQEAYAASGYALARVVVPTQEIDSDGVVRVLVIDGFIEAVNADALPARVRGRVGRVLSGLVGARGVSDSAIERQLLIAGDTAGLQLEATLTPGAQTGGAVLVLTGAHKLVAAVLAADSRVAKDLGGYQVTASAALNSALGAGEQLYATIAGYPNADLFTEESRRRYFSLGGTVPVGADGWMIGMSADYSSTRPEGASAPLQLKSQYARLGVAASYPFIRTRHLNLAGRIGFDAIEERQETLLGMGATLSLDQTRVVRLGLTASGPLWEGRARGGVDVELSRGIDGLGARSAADASILKPLSRQGADAEFTRLAAEASIAANVGMGADLSVHFSGQYNFDDPLLRSEQFTPIGRRAISGPPAGELVGDRGAAIRAELGRAFPLHNTDLHAVAPYVFAAAATTSYEQPTVLERETTELTAIGVGVDFTIRSGEAGGPITTFNLEWSQLGSDAPAFDRSWVGAAIVTRF